MIPVVVARAGEAAPVPKAPGDEALGGTLNAGDVPLEVRHLR